MRLLAGYAACLVAALIVSGVAIAQTMLPRDVVQVGPLVRFTGDAALDHYASRLAGSSEAAGAVLDAPVPPPPQVIAPPPPSLSLPNIAPPQYLGDAAAADAAPAAADAAPEAITNTQVAGVDEGGIVKNAGDFLVVLRRGRLFTIRTGGDSLAPVAAIDAFPPGKKNAGDAWYDEMLIHGDQVIVIGYSYGGEGTEINRFRIGADGSLSFRDTHYLSSGDYYSDENYASRLLGDRLVFYTPLPMWWNDWRQSLPTLRRRLPGGRLGQPQRLMDARGIYMAADSFAAGAAPEILHTVTSCDLSAAELACTASGVAGDWSRSFYVSASAAYVWTGTTYAAYAQSSGQKPIPAKLVRLPLDGSAPGAITVSGGPVNQFSFDEDAGGGMLRVVVRGEGQGEAMWASRISSGETGLLTIPLAAFTSGNGIAAGDAMRKLPEAAGARFENRFVGRYLLYSAMEWEMEPGMERGGEGGNPQLFAVPFDGGNISRIALPHSAARLDVLGRDAVVVGSDAHGGLGFTAVALGAVPQVQSTFILPDASEGESRSQAFFYRADPGSDGDTGTLGLPVMRRNWAAILFLRRDARALAEAGELAARSGPPPDDNCIASCVDWYGNARPIFMGGRVFALLGYELVEGSLAQGRISERRRVDFSPTQS